MWKHGVQVTSPHITCVPRSDATAEAELDGLAAVYKFVLFDSQTSKGGPNDLTNGSTPKSVKNGPRKTDKEKT
jgi:hypothetical protein